MSTIVILLAKQVAHNNLVILVNKADFPPPFFQYDTVVIASTRIRIRFPAN
jgi:hypothetical protein